MTLTLTPRRAQPIPGSRQPTQADAELLARLMLDAYRGTIDGEGETLESARREVARLFAGDFGQLAPDFSGVVQRDGELASATLITIENGMPLLAFSMTAAGWKRQGLAAAGLACVCDSLLAAGYERLRLVVTRGSAPAEALYRRFGFVEELSTGV
jgi:RimJ/RimL family protein N-acetyltransferase